MPEDAGFDIDFDTELAAIQGHVAGVPQPEPRQVQVVAGTIVTSERTVEFMGERFRVADKIGLMPLLKFSAHADMSTADPGAMAAMYSMIKDCIHPGTPGCGTCEKCAPERCGECRACQRAEDGADPDASPCTVNAPDERSCQDFDPGDWSRFEHHAIDTKADAEELLDVIAATVELISGRPTEQPSPSSGGRRNTRDNSMARSSARRAKGSKR
jgi:hypothetical protein